MATRRVTLKRVYELAKKNEGFLDAVLRNPEKALAKEGLSLSEKDLAALRRWLRKVYKISGRNLVRLLMIPAKVERIYPWPKSLP